jgi:hypothetical protein
MDPTTVSEEKMAAVFMIEISVSVGNSVWLPDGC